MVEEKNFFSDQENENYRSLDASLRPKNFDEFVGQDNIKENLKIFIQAAQKRGEALEHILFYGGAGLGKTTLAYIIANEIKKNIRITSGPVLERVGDLAAILSNLSDGDILFIDEIHRLNKNIEEVLYPALEDYAIDLILGKGPSARTLRLDLPRFTLIGATTRASLLSSPLRDRFGLIFELGYYNLEDLIKIIDRSSKILKIEIEDEAKLILAQRARFTPRIVNRLLKRARDFAQVKNKNIITKEIAKEAMEKLEIDEKGLTPTDRRCLEVLINKFNGGPVGLKSWAVAGSIEEKTLEEIYEPYLIQIGFIQRTPKGRKATPLSYQYLTGKGLEIKKLI